MPDEKREGIPLGFVQLDPKVALKAIEGHEDVLAGEAKTLEALYRQHSDCPRGCGPTMTKETLVKFAFADPEYVNPRMLMKCSHCGCLLNPFDGMIVELGDPDTANAGGIVIKPGDD